MNVTNEIQAQHETNQIDKGQKEWQSKARDAIT